MYLSPNSRYNLANVVQDEAGYLSFALPDSLAWQDLEGVQAHVVEEGDNLWLLAARYYHFVNGETGARLWWAIAQFQPEPIIDPTIQLQVGQTILIPPMIAIQTVLAGPAGENMMGAE